MNESRDHFHELQQQGISLGEGDGKALPFPHPPRGCGSVAHERPLSNKLISIRANRKMGAIDTGGSIELFPSMVVRKRDWSEFEADYYEMIARYGKKSRVSGSTRGQIDHFSDDSRFRLLKKLGSIGRQDPPFMVTKTYRSGSVTLKEAKRDLLKWRSRMDREFGIRHETSEAYVRKDGLPAIRKRYKYEGKWSGVWRFEVTTGRGARAKCATPHFHTLVWCDEWHGMNLNELDETLSQMWCDVTGDGGPDRMKYGCRLDVTGGDQTKIKNYMLGHHGKKTDQEVMGGGRHWGIMNEELLKIGQPTAVYSLTYQQRQKYDRLSSKLIAKRANKDVRDNSDLRETHTVLSPHDAYRILEFIGAKKQEPDPF